MSSKLNILNTYLTSFPFTDNKLFSQGAVIEIVLSMLLTVWLSSMTIAVIDSTEKSHEDLIEYPEKLEVSLPEEVIPKNDKIKKPVYRRECSIMIL